MRLYVIHAFAWMTRKGLLMYEFAGVTPTEKRSGDTGGMKLIAKVACAAGRHPPLQRNWATEPPQLSG